MKHYKLVIFDWDGTLMDSVGKIVECMQQAAAQCGEPVPSAEQVGNIIGISLHPAVAQLFGLKDEQKIESIVAAYKTAYVTKDQRPCPMFEGATQLLKALHSNGRQLAVATGKARRGLDRAWQHTATGDYFVASRTACDAQSKPSSDMLQQLLSETGVAVDEAVMIGDTVYDMQMAQQLGMDRIGVTYGVHDSQQLNNHMPVAVVNSVPELHRYLLG
ncbi:HAD family hydrolase [Alteromonas lipotrueiana]|uniref:HAD family hydrolase n=1 Tax=Alteromonas lipotrueiana TaxID=2803815 RepID=UPI001C450923|nr:HAD-IA family hydrolase [Alteromonas lipotrueiana]